MQKNACGLLVIIKYFEKCPFEYGRFYNNCCFFQKMVVSVLPVSAFFLKKCSFLNGRFRKRAFAQTGIFQENGHFLAKRGKKNLWVAAKEGLLGLVNVEANEVIPN